MKYQKISRLTATAAALAVLATAGASAAELKPKTETTPVVSYTTMKMKSADLEPGAALEEKNPEEMYGIYEKVGVTQHEDGTLWYKDQRVGSLEDQTAGLLYYDSEGAVHLRAVYDGESLTGVEECEAPKVGQAEILGQDGETINFKVTEPSQSTVGGVYTITASGAK